jgi:hypothetical protein
MKQVEWVRIIKRSILGAIVVAGAMACGLAPAQAASTKGGAQAAFQAFGTGGIAILKHGSHGGAPADLEGSTVIRPFGRFDGLHYCTDDWLLLTIAGNVEGDKSLTMQQAKAIVESETYNLFLDGSELNYTQTATKRLPFPEVFSDAKEIYTTGYSVIVAPGDLSLGSHTFGFEHFDADGNVLESDEITFFIDASGTGACL